MANKGAIFGRLSAALLCAVSAVPVQVAAFDLTGTVWDRPSTQGCRPSPELLYAIALVESKKYAGRMVTPNPYALNIDGKGFHPRAALPRPRASAVGAMQISLRWNGGEVSAPADLLDLRTNVRTATKVFCGFQKQGGDLALLIGRYHTPNPDLVSVARAYGEDVLRVWRRLVLLKQEGEQG